ncbi:MAG: FixH family protein [Magnetovibrio sp.]|nr:FixH family protein [Magnetovibrio sp.]
MSKTPRADGWWYPWIFVGAFGIIFTVNGIMAYFAVTTWTGLETKDYFNQGMSYNDVLEQRTQQEALGWTATLTYQSIPTADDPRAGVLHLRIIDKNEQAINGLTINAIARRPTHEGYDRNLTFTYQDDGSYTSTETLPLAGLWELRYAAMRGEMLFKLRQRFQVR